MDDIGYFLVRQSFFAGPTRFEFEKAGKIWQKQL